jgi:uncharacterized protein YdhG (YjbR/CyaY superfamily)
MQSKAANVTAYLGETPVERREALQKLRQVCLQSLKGYEECMEFGMAAYKRNGAVEVAFASQKQYVSLYVLKKEVIDRHRKTLIGCSIGKGCIRFPRADRIDFDSVRLLLQDVVQSKTKPC